MIYFGPKIFLDVHFFSPKVFRLGVDFVLPLSQQQEEEEEEEEQPLTKIY